MKTERIIAFVNLEYNVKCPECENYFDITPYTDDVPIYHGSHEDVDISMVCPVCQGEFVINDIEN